MNPMPWEVKRAIETWPSQMWYLMLDSNVRPTRGKIDDPRLTGKKRKAQHVLPRYASLSETLRNFACHLQENDK